MVLLDIDVEIPEDTPVDVEINLPILDDEPINQSLRRKHSHLFIIGLRATSILMSRKRCT